MKLEMKKEKMKKKMIEAVDYCEDNIDLDYLDAVITNMFYGAVELKRKRNSDKE